MGLAEEIKKASRGEPSRVTFTDERMEDADAVDNFAEEVRKRGYNPNIALASAGTNPEKQRQYLESLDAIPIHPEYDI
ncbi:MAG: hypothetical protein Q7S56_02115 [Nanoarchaeota archaeon]|nr:hypothetical protein [Nanoarchaeota archaeon]